MTVATPQHLSVKSLLAIEDLSNQDILAILDETARIKQACACNEDLRHTLPNRTLVNLFFENSTRTRLSFEIAARKLGVDVVNFEAPSSSLTKGESLIDTVRTIDAMRPDFLVVRHSSSGAAHIVQSHARAAILNAGDGAHEHPTQSLLDCFTIREAVGAIEGASIAIIGDLLYSRVARSNVFAFTKLGANVTIFGPPALAPGSFRTLGVTVARSLEEALDGANVVYLLRIQRERQADGLAPAPAEYRRLFGIDETRLSFTAPGAILMHPGPVNRDVEIDAHLLNHPCSVIETQVENGVFVRMAVLKLLVEARP